MRLNKEEHKRIMLNILSDISSDPSLSINLGFKGGTCCYFVYGLDRFSVDLDFDLLDISKSKEVVNKIDNLLARYGYVKKNGIYSRKVKYSDESSALKIDISDRVDLNKLNHYKVRDVISGIPLNILSKEDVFAHKLLAVMDRYHNKKINKAIANRDLYDINFFFEQRWNFNEKIIKLRSQKNAREYLLELREFIEKKVDEKKILDGIGALVDESKRQWLRKNLKREVLKKLAIQIEAMRK